MALSAAQRDRVNTAIAAYLGVAPGTNYLTSRVAFAPVVTKLEVDGWRLVRPDGSTSVNWQNETELVLERSQIIRITRSPEHQALVESMGQVERGADTYERRIVERSAFSLRSFMRDGETKNTVSTIIEAAALCALRRSPRHKDWVRDDGVR